ncbi:hypothetical protein ADN00_16315 [Ornatilinea apprima]|uniref:histidine kinase n=2 Tax=Ornatilinea apprima TaxID=1134406 RepID=A0A0P6XAD3_9CHLR|nr:hypothetical protein ADN00_16315 [Ornatilinea apprima]
MKTLIRNKPTIGVLAGWQFYRTATNLSYLAPVFRGIIRASQDFGCNLLLGCGMGPSASPTDPIRPAWSEKTNESDFVPIGPWNTDGMIIANPLQSESRSRYIRNVIDQGHPIVFVGSGELGPTIVADNQGGIKTAMSHLVAHSHQRIAFIAGTREDSKGDSGERLRAYQSAIRSFQLNLDPKLITYGRHTFNGGYTAMKELLSKKIDFSAVLASNDESALGAIKAMNEAGIRVPDDVAVIGFDNRFEGAVHSPSLSSIHVPLFEIGYKSVEVMVNYLTRQEELPELVTMNTKLITRDSCGCGALRSAILNRENLTASQLTEAISTIVLDQSHSLTKKESDSLCAQLVSTFTNAITSNEKGEFEEKLSEILQHTIDKNEASNIWQDALTLLENNQWGETVSRERLQEVLNHARLLIGRVTANQHNQYLLNERWISSRLSLLSAKLQTSLDEDQIYQTLNNYLSDLELDLARLSLFEPADELSHQSCMMRDLLNIDAEPISFNCQNFPPADCFPQDKPFFLTLIPVMDPKKQLGFMVFGTDYLEIFGFIVQQVGGALNTASLYRQATEGRRLAEEANRIKNRFLSTISHDLRTPINLILGLTDVLLEENDWGQSALPISVQMDIERINAYAQHLGGMIGDVLDLATNSAGQLRLQMGLVNLGEALQMVAESGLQLATDKGLGWKAVVPKNGPWVRGDITRLRQVVLNLVNNAIKFTTKGEVALIVEVDDENVRVSIKDTGLGIPVDEQETIFNEFHRSERSILQGFSGLGLGLSICKTLVEMQNGTIGVDSSGVEGEGSTFFFTLPVVDHIDEQQPTLNESWEQEKTFLIVHSGGENHERLRNLLKDYGVKVAAIGIDQFEDWRKRFSDSFPDAIVLDMSSHTEKGWRILRNLKTNKVTRNVPIMLYTHSQDGETLINLDYLTKPIELDELNITIDQYLLTEDAIDSKRTFLIVDDDINTLEMNARIIQSQYENNRLFKANNGEEALKILGKEKIDLVLLDLNMPVMDGFAVLESMRVNPKMREIPVIILTGRELSIEEMNCLNQGVATVLKKGIFSMEETLSHVNAALERKRRLSTNAQKLVRQAMVFIQDHYTDPISRADVAKHVNIAEDYLTYCFRQELGTTPIKYLQRFRINQAKNLLKNSDKSITEIAVETGFSDSGYFSRLFHRETGMSPEAFKLSLMNI